MNSTDIQSKIQAASNQFVAEIVAVFSEAFASVASDLAVKAPAKAKTAAIKHAGKSTAKAPAKPVAAKTAKPAKPGKRIRRSEDQLVADGEKVVKLLASNKKGLRVEQINKMLGASTSKLARPILMLLAEGKIRKEGERRATVYFPA
jgi:hypothetical protein